MDIENEIINSKKNSCKLKYINLEEVKDFINNNLCILFPNMYEECYDDNYFNIKICKIKDNLKQFKSYFNINNDDIFNQYFNEFKVIDKMLIKDLIKVLETDPSCKSKEEVILSYPGFIAIVYYRIAGILVKLNIPIIPRIISLIAYRNTSIDINPYAKIGGNFFIDHGCGVVIGEDTIIGNNVTLYHGVTLGSKKPDVSENKRHPTIKDNVTIYSNSTILGGNTVVGKDSIIGCNVIVTTPVDDYSFITINSKRNIKNI